MKKTFFRLLFLVVIIVIFVYYVSKNIGTIEQTVHLTLSQSVGYLAVSAFFATLAFYFMVLMNRKVFEMLGIRRTPLQMFLLQTQALAMNVIVPSAGVSVGVVFAGDAKKHGDSEAAAVTAVILALLVDYTSIALLLTIAMLYLASIHSLGLQVVVPSLAFFLLTFGLFLLIYFAGKNRKLLKGILDWCKNLANRIVKWFKRPLVIKNETVVDSFILELENTYKIMSGNRKPLYQALGFILASQLMYLICLYVLFLSLGIEPLYRVILAGYAIGVMVVVISPTPNGAGLVEGSMTLAYTSMGISGAIAAAVTLIYRGFCFWIPLIVGFVSLQRKHFLGLTERFNK